METLAYFKNAKIGDRVWDYVYGEGEIKYENGFQIKVYFGMGCIHHYYNLDGTSTEYMHNQRLFYYKDRPTIILNNGLWDKSDSKVHRETPEFIKDTVKETIKPPTGLRPQFISEEEYVSDRQQEILNAINRYIKVNKPIPAKWLQEWMELLDGLNKLPIKKRKKV